MFNDAFPIISTPDMQRSLGFYHDLLEGEVEYQFPPEGEPGHVGMNIGSAHVGIGYAPDAMLADARAAGATVTEEPADQPWGERVARVLDPDGNEVIVGQKA